MALHISLLATNHIIEAPPPYFYKSIFHSPFSSPDRDELSDYSWGSKYGYVINGEKFSLLEIEHAILRGNQKCTKRKIKAPIISKHDPRFKYVLKPDPRVHFALLRISSSHPVVTIFSGKGGETELKQAVAISLSSEVKVDKNEVIVPKVFAIYKEDFGGKEPFESLKWISEHLPHGQRREVCGISLS